MRPAGLILAAVVASCLATGCATRIELTPAERAALAPSLAAQAGATPERLALVVEARPADGPGGDLHVIVDGDRICLVLLDPLGVVMKSILTPERLWLRARDPGGRPIEATCPGGDQRVCLMLAALRALRPFAARPLPLTGDSRGWLHGPRLVVEAPIRDGGTMVERRTFDRADLRCVERAVLQDGRVLALVHHGPSADVLELELPDLGLRLRLTVLERDANPDIAPGAFTPG